MIQGNLFGVLKARRIRKSPPSEPWVAKALKTQGDLVFNAIKSMNLSQVLRADIDSIDKKLVSLGLDLTRPQIRAGAKNALERGLLDKEGYDRFFIPIEGKPRKYKMKQKKGSS